MQTAARQTASWLTVLFFAFICALGEGLHLFPGCGHYVETPWGIIAVGVQPAADRCPLDNSEKRVGQSSPPTIRVLQPGQCPICSVVAQVKQSAKTQGAESSAKLVTRFASWDLVESTRDRSRAFHARAPPVG